MFSQNRWSSRSELSELHPPRYAPTSSNLPIPWICLALGQLMLYVDGMNAVMNQNEVVQWLYSLVESSVGEKIFD